MTINLRSLWNRVTVCSRDNVLVSLNWINSLWVLVLLKLIQPVLHGPTLNQILGSKFVKHQDNEATRSVPAYFKQSTYILKECKIGTVWLNICPHKQCGLPLKLAVPKGYKNQITVWPWRWSALLWSAPPSTIDVLHIQCRNPTIKAQPE